MIYLNYSLRWFWCTGPFPLNFIYVLLFQCLLYRMSDSESIKKMLRSVLQSSKRGVSISSLQSEYRSLCGEYIPLKKLGFSKLEDYVQSIPSVVRLEYRMGEVRLVLLLRPIIKAIGSLTVISLCVIAYVKPGVSCIQLIFLKII